MSRFFNGLLSSTIMYISVYFFGKIVFQKTRKKTPLYYLIFSLMITPIYAIIFIKFDGILKTILLCGINVVTNMTFFKIKIEKAVISSIIYIVILVIPDLITMGGAIYVLNLNKEYIYDSVAGGILSNLSVCLIMILLTFLLRKPLRKFININISSNKKIIVVFSLILITILIFFYNLINTFQFNNDIAGFIIAMIFLGIILFYVFKQKIENESILKKYDELLDIMKNYESDIEEQRTLIHETRNELSTIRCKIKDKEKESEIIDYIDSIIGDKVSSKMSKYSKFKYLPSNGLKGFFYYKFSEAERKGINVSLNISKQIENSILAKLDTKNFKDLARVIGVYLDNAIEASSESDDKKLGIEIYSINENVEIIISNTYNNSIDREKIGNEKTSTKGEKRGHGLLLVKRILGDSKIIKSENQITEKIYIQKIIVKNEKNQ